MQNAIGRRTPDGWESNVLAGLEGLNDAQTFASWAPRRDATEVTRAPATFQFDGQLDVDPPPRLA